MIVKRGQEVVAEVKSLEVDRPPEGVTPAAPLVAKAGHLVGTQVKLPQLNLANKGVSSQMVELILTEVQNLK